jgi:hypothetical protein
MEVRCRLPNHAGLVSGAANFTEFEPERQSLVAAVW